MNSPDWLDQIDWNKGNGLLPAIVQNAINGQVLMVGYMNQAALQQSLSNEQVTFYSRSKQRLWTKGESSGHTLTLVDVALDCDQDTLLVLAHPQGPTCHLMTASCFGEHNAVGDDSYTRSLLAAGVERCAQKVGEEGVEVALAAVANDTDKLNEEAADLLYHLLVALKAAGTELDSVLQVLERRHNAG
jgi:phosphoribosyl-ATP pyrophosphohydrolase/phosphoribosyl-AMP cyclohydrolase